MKNLFKKTWFWYLIALFLLVIVSFTIGYFKLIDYREAVLSGDMTSEEFLETFGASQTSDFEIDVDHYFSEPDSNEVKALSSGSPFFGSEDAKVKIVAFEDFYCSHCINVYPEVKKIINNYGDRIQFVFRHYPVLGDTRAAVASTCANEQGLFWPYHDLLFTSQVPLEAEILKTYAVQLGLDEFQFNNCYDTEKYKTKIQSDVAVGQAYGAPATPTIFINNFQISGEFKYEQIKQIIDYLLEYYQ